MNRDIDQVSRYPLANQQDGLPIDYPGLIEYCHFRLPVVSNKTVEWLIPISPSQDLDARFFSTMYQQLRRTMFQAVKVVIYSMLDMLFLSLFSVI